MRASRFLLVSLLLALPALAASPDGAVKMLRLSAERAGTLSIVRVERPTAQGPVTVTVLAGARSRLFLRKSRPDTGTHVYEAYLDSRPGVLVTRAANGPLLLEAGGFSVRVHEADLGLKTVRCWIGSLVSRMEPRLLVAAADVQVVKEWGGWDKLGDEFLPIRLLASVGEAPDLKARGELKAEDGPFEGAPWDDLCRAALDELGKP
jgi:hypothetical protein